MQKNYRKTLIASYLGFITQALCANFAPLLFLRFHKIYGIPLGKIALISTTFFFTQLVVDFLCAKYVDRIGYRLKPGDIVLVHTAGRYILHRLIAHDGDALTLMGDGNLQGTESCTTADVVGTVTAVIRPSGREQTPGKGRLWRILKPLRRYLLAIYRRLI